MGAIISDYATVMRECWRKGWRITLAGGETKYMPVDVVIEGMHGMNRGRKVLKTFPNQNHQKVINETWVYVKEKYYELHTKLYKDDNDTRSVSRKD